MITVTLYRQSNCPACDQVEADLAELQSTVPHQLVVVDVESDSALKASVGDQLPVVQVGPYRLKETITRQELQIALGAAADRFRHLEMAGDTTHQRRLERGHRVSGTDRATLWFSHHYMILINLLVLLYVGLPFMAPVLENQGARLPAKILYTIYSPLCHQLSFRSYFLFGAQPVYPLERAGVEGLATYEETIGQGRVDITEAREFIGNEVIGYKVALCERDVAMYGGLLATGLLFALTGRRWKALPWYLWVLIGLGPIGLDGTSQLPAFIAPYISWLPVRESTPLLRTFTGLIFGVTTGWFLFPMIEESMRETRAMIRTKQAVVAQTQPK